MTSPHLTIAATLLLIAVPLASATQPALAFPDAPWGKPADGIACRVLARPSYVVGEALTVVLEIKNVSERRRYLVPRLHVISEENVTVHLRDPRGSARVTIETQQGQLGEGSFKPFDPGQTERYEIPDLRASISVTGEESTNDPKFWNWDTAKRLNSFPTGKYRLQISFESPRPPVRLDFGDDDVKIRSALWRGPADSNVLAFELKSPDKDELVIHEWGVFTVFNDAEYANENRREEWGNLPSFFYRQFPVKNMRLIRASWDKPVVYVYAKPSALRMSFEVKFTRGAPVVWWPCTVSPVDDAGNDPDNSHPTTRPVQALVWEAWVGERIPKLDRETWLDAKVHGLPPNCWVNHVRLPEASLLTVNGFGGISRNFVTPWTLGPTETERFLYYDGLMTPPDLLRCEAVADHAVVLKNRSDFAMKRLFVVDRRNKSIRFADTGDTPPLAAGTARRVETSLIAAADWPETGRRQVRQALCDAGLFGPEADALLKVWQSRLLEAGGITAFYILPGPQYDAMLPLSMNPAPAAAPVRVGIALHPRIEFEPQNKTIVIRLIAQLSDPNYAQRVAATRALEELGFLAAAGLRDELKKNLPLETRRRLEAVLARIDAADWMLPPDDAKAK